MSHFRYDFLLEKYNPSLDIYDVQKAYILTNHLRSHKKIIYVHYEGALRCNPNKAKVNYT